MQRIARFIVAIKICKFSHHLIVSLIHGTSRHSFPISAYRNSYSQDRCGIPIFERIHTKKMIPWLVLQESSAVYFSQRHTRIIIGRLINACTTMTESSVHHRVSEMVIWIMTATTFRQASRNYQRCRTKERWNLTGGSGDICDRDGVEIPGINGTENIHSSL